MVYRLLNYTVDGITQMYLPNDEPYPLLTHTIWYDKVQNVLRKHVILAREQIKELCWGKRNKQYRQLLIKATKNGYLNRYVVWENEAEEKAAFTAYSLTDKNLGIDKAYEPDKVKLLEFIAVNEFLIKNPELYRDFRLFPSNKTELVGTIRLNNELQLGLWVPKEVDEIDDIDLLEEEMGKYNLHGLLIITYLEKVPLIEEWLGHLDIGEILVVDEENISDVYYLKDSILEALHEPQTAEAEF